MDAFSAWLFGWGCEKKHEAPEKIMANTIDQHNHLNKVILVGLLIGFLLNLTGWVGNNIILGSMWDELGASIAPVAWRESVWSDVFSLIPDFVYGIAITWMIVKTRLAFRSVISTSVSVGGFVSLIGGITTYFAIANSGFIPWSLAIASILLVLVCKVPLAVLAGFLLYREPHK